MASSAGMSSSQASIRPSPRTSRTWGSSARPADLPAAVRSGLSARRGVMDLDIPESGIDIEELERSLIVKALQKSSGNVSRAARLLGLSRRTLQYRLENYHSLRLPKVGRGPTSALAYARPISSVGPSARE